MYLSIPSNYSVGGAFEGLIRADDVVVAAAAVGVVVVAGVEWACQCSECWQ